MTNVRLVLAVSFHCSFLKPFFSNKFFFQPIFSFSHLVFFKLQCPPGAIRSNIRTAILSFNPTRFKLNLFLPPFFAIRPEPTAINDQIDPMRTGIERHSLFYGFCMDIHTHSVDMIVNSASHILAITAIMVQHQRFEARKG